MRLGVILVALALIVMFAVSGCASAPKGHYEEYCSPEGDLIRLKSSKDEFRTWVIGICEYGVEREGKSHNQDAAVE